MKKLILLFLALSLTACAGQTSQQTTGKTLLAMHDLVKVSAVAANDLCAQKVAPLELCGKIKIGYTAFQKSWPIVNDASVVYLKAPASDTGATVAFNIANTVFIKDYTELMALFATTGILKENK